MLHQILVTWHSFLALTPHQNHVVAISILMERLKRCMCLSQTGALTCTATTMQILLITDAVMDIALARNLDKMVSMQEQNRMFIQRELGFPSRKLAKEDIGLTRVPIARV